MIHGMACLISISALSFPSLVREIPSLSNASFCSNIRYGINRFLRVIKLPLIGNLRRFNSSVTKELKKIKSWSSTFSSVVQKSILYLLPKRFTSKGLYIILDDALTSSNVRPQSCIYCSILPSSICWKSSMESSSPTVQW